MSKSPRSPMSPEVAQVVAAMQSGRLSRRSMLGAAGALGATAALSACGTTGSTGGQSSAGGSSSAAASEAGPSAATDVSDTDKVVNWANWTLYLDLADDGKSYPTLVEFQKESGLKATYAEDIDDNETYYGKIQAQLRQGQDIGKDIITLTDWMAARLIKAGWVQKLDQANIKNGKNILPSLKGSNIAWDPNRDFSYTWQSGFGGFGWSTKNLKEATGGKLTAIRTLDDLWNPALKGKVEVLSEMRDTMGIILRSQGVNINAGLDMAKWQKALDVLNDKIGSGHIRQVKGNSYKEDLVSGDAVAVIGWSGDMFQLATEDKAGNDFKFNLPESGGTLWSDNLMVPIGATHKKNAEKLINYYYDPAVAAKVAAYVNYICPVVGAKEEMLKSADADLKALATNKWIFPDAATLANAQSFMALDADLEKQFTTSFQKVLGV